MDDQQERGEEEGKSSGSCSGSGSGSGSGSVLRACIRGEAIRHPPQIRITCVTCVHSSDASCDASCTLTSWEGGKVGR